MSKECGNGKGKRASIPPSAKLENLLPALKSPRPLVLGKDCDYDRELRRLQIELVKLQEWIRKRGLKVIVLFEGSDAAGKGGAIRRITQSLNPRVCRVVALGTATEREKAQRYFQRYGADLPAAGELVLFDAAGTSGPARSASWDSALRPSTWNSYTAVRSSNACWCARGSS